MLDVSVDANDGFPELEHVCEKYKRRLERLEKAAEDLESFRAQVRALYASLRLKRSELKRSKDTSSIDASPDTVRVRPPSKQLLTARHLDFDDCMFIEVLYTIPLLHFQSDGRATNSLKCVRYRALHLRILWTTLANLIFMTSTYAERAQKITGSPESWGN